MIQKLLFCCSIFLLIAIACYSEDRIVLISGKERKCTILNEDSVSVNVLLKSNGKVNNTSINRKYIQSIIYDRQTNLKRKITFTDSSFILCTIIHEDSISVSANIDENGLEKTLYFNKGSVRTIEKLNNNIENEHSNYRRRTDNFYISFGPSFPINNIKDFGADIKTGGNAALNLSFGLNQNINVSFKTYVLINSSEKQFNYALWKSAGLLSGLEYILPTEYIDFRFRFLGGFMFLESPEYKDNSSSIELFKLSTNTLGYNIGIGFDIKNTTNSYFLINVEYLHGYFNFHDAIVKNTLVYTVGIIFHEPIPGLPNMPSIETIEKKEVYELKSKLINVLNLNIGFGYNF